MKVVRVSNLPKIIYRFNAISSRNSNRGFVGCDRQISKRLWNSKGLRRLDASDYNEEVEGTFYKTVSFITEFVLYVVQR